MRVLMQAVCLAYA